MLGGRMRPPGQEQGHVLHAPRSAGQDRHDGSEAEGAAEAEAAAQAEAASKECSVDGCGKRAVTRGWCHPHYQRWHKHGDPLGGRGPRTPRVGGQPKPKPKPERMFPVEPPEPDTPWTEEDEAWYQEHVGDPAVPEYGYRVLGLDADPSEMEVPGATVVFGWKGKAERETTSRPMLDADGNRMLCAVEDCGRGLVDDGRYACRWHNMHGIPPDRWCGMEVPFEVQAALEALWRRNWGEMTEKQMMAHRQRAANARRRGG